MCCPKDSSLSRQNFVLLGKRVPLERRRQIGVSPLKRRYFAVIGSCTVKTVADRYRHDALVTDFLALSTSMTFNDLEAPQKGFLVNFSQFLDAAHISTLNCVEMAGDRPRQPAY